MGLYHHIDNIRKFYSTGVQQHESFIYRRFEIAPWNKSHKLFGAHHKSKAPSVSWSQDNFHLQAVTKSQPEGHMRPVYYFEIQLFPVFCSARAASGPHQSGKTCKAALRPRELKSCYGTCAKSHAHTKLSTTQKNQEWVPFNSRRAPWKISRHR